MAKRKLNYRFHNPNPVEVTANYILKAMIEANTEKVEKILQDEIKNDKRGEEYMIEKRKYDIMNQLIRRA